MNSIVTRSLAASSFALVAALGIVGCSQSSPDTTSSPSASASASVAQTRYNECIDGSIQIFDDADSDKPVSYGDCAGGSIISSERTITLGSVPTLTVEGQKNTIDVKDVKSLTLLGNGNTVTFHGEMPKVDDQGTDNTVKPAG